jgi:hypothetical protein
MSTAALAPRAGLSIFLASFLFSSTGVFADAAKTDAALSVSDVQNQVFQVPLQSSVTARVGAENKSTGVNLKTPIGDHELMVNYRRPYLHVQPQDFLEKSGLTLADLNSIFKNTNNKIEDYRVIANFSHGFENYLVPFAKPTTAEDKSIFWYAVLPKNTIVNNAGVQVEWFVEGIGNHMQLHFSLNQNILLIPQKLENSKQLADQGQSLLARLEDRTMVGEGQYNIDVFGATDRPVLIKGEIIYALMGLKAFGGPQEFSFVNGITGNLTIGLTMASVGHMALDQMSRGSFVEEYPLKLSQVELNRSLEYVFQQNTGNNPTANLYNTVFQNCIKEVVKAIGYGISDRTAQISFDADQFNPYSVPAYLIKKGVVEKSAIPLNKLFPGYDLVNQSRQTEENKAAIKKVNVALQIIKEDDLDIFVREFAYGAAINQWKQESINDYFKLMSSKLKTPKVFESFNVNLFMNLDSEWRQNENKDQIIQIDNSIKKILLGIMKDNTVAEIKKIKGNLAIINPLKLRIPKLEHKVFMTYLSVLSIINSVRQ